MNQAPIIKRAETAEDFLAAKSLIVEYVQWLGIDLSFQQLDKEMDTLPEMYGVINGGLFIAYNLQQAVGVAGVRRFNDTSAEIKRMFVQPGGRGLGIGQLLLAACIEAAKEAGYQSILLDTIDTMQAAIKVYTSAGFTEIPAYRHNPHPGAKYFELKLSNT